MRRVLALTAVLLTAVVLFAACEDDILDENTEPAPPIATATAAPPETPTATPAESGAEAYHITGVDYAFRDVPASVPAGSEFTFSNGSATEVHELVLVRLPDDETRSVEELLQLPEEELVPLLMPGLTGVSVAMPGSDGMVVEGSLVADQPGRYIMLCMIPTGADPEEFMEAAQGAQEGPPQVEGGPPHIVHGMYAELTVE